MATYKVLQDIEAEDKLVGPLSLRQFIYAGIAVLAGYLTFFVISRGAAFLSIIFLPFVLFFGFLAIPWRSEQPTEVWALAKLRFYLKPRRRTWNQSGVTELVTITAPKQAATNFGPRYSQVEVQNRLRALASTVDTRGWAVKNSSINLSTSPTSAIPEASDRLSSPTILPQTVTADPGINAADDMLDERNNPRAQAVTTKLREEEQAHRQKLLDELRKPSEPTQPTAQGKPQQPVPNFWFMNQPQTPAQTPKGTVTFNTQVVEPGQETATAEPAVSRQDENELIHELDERRKIGPTATFYGHLPTIQPLSAQKKQPVAADNQQPVIQTIPQLQQPAAPAAATPSPLNEQLAHRDDLNIATIARQADQSDQNEVTIKLH